VLLVDERHTSAEAGAEFKKARQAGQRGRVRRERIDAASAVLIAERYLQGGAL
jgi:RNase H-fold protein (predicted Holliday junction resolvase)